jgi:hypothetical protein
VFSKSKRLNVNIGYSYKKYKRNINNINVKYTGKYTERIQDVNINGARNSRRLQMNVNDRDS